MNTAFSASDWSNSKEDFVIFQSMRRFFVIALVSAIVSATGFAASADDAARRTFAYCDKNKDGRLGAGELDGIPASMRGWLSKHGPKSKSGISQADFLRVYPQMMADLRKQTPVASASGTPTQATDASADPRPATTGGNDKTTVKPPLYASTPPSDEVVETVRPSNLPASYQDADLDKDGQIDYFEWRKAKLGDFAKFQELDLNNDSVLSARELGAGGATFSSASSSSSTASSASDSKTESPRVSSVPSAPGAPSEEYLKKVKFYFYYMDGQGEKYGGEPYKFGNKNGKLDPIEWNASKRIKPAFQKAGIDITKPMDEKTFIMHYSKVFPEVKKPAPPKIGFGQRPGFFTPAAKGTSKRKRGGRRRGN
jgi:EF hand